MSCFGLFDQRWIAAKPPHDQPMHHQLRGIANHTFVQSVIHLFIRAQLEI
ncbi:hypothetical protein BF49_2683 [Bradyrhizobium sp.]|nr:hypothetical protein BF49_2683 [Bradyrhizobium sp.]